MHDVLQTGDPPAVKPQTVDTYPIFVTARLGNRIDVVQYVQHARPPSARVNERYISHGACTLHLAWREQAGALEDEVWREHNFLATSPEALRQAWANARARYIAT